MQNTIIPLLPYQVISQQVGSDPQLIAMSLHGIGHSSLAITIGYLHIDKGTAGYLKV